jgi:hypothetical protein
MRSETSCAPCFGNCRPLTARVEEELLVVKYEPNTRGEQFASIIGWMLDACYV